MEKERRNRITENELAKILSMITTIEFGSVNIVIHDGKIAQIEKTEKLRFPKEE